LWIGEKINLLHVFLNEQNYCPGKWKGADDGRDETNIRKRRSEYARTSKKLKKNTT